MDVPRSAGNLGTLLVSSGVSPRDIVAMHTAAVGPNEGPELVVAQQFLLEVLIAYGVEYSLLAEVRLAEADARAASEQTLAEGAEQAETDRLNLLAGVSHELGTPLTVIKGNVVSIRRFLEERESWPEELSQREDDVEFAVERILALREELLAASRNQARELDVAPVHIHRSLQRVVRWARVAAREKGTSLSESYEATDPYSLGDEWGVQSVFGNLLSNAVRYTPPGGSITVRTYDEGTGIAVDVADTGIGVSEDDQPRVFERFYRTAEAQRAVPFGIGLGLAITRDLVSAMHCSISLTSKPGSGTTFTVTFLRADLADLEEESQ
jgi:signal transduction histidine kinase